MTLVGLASLTLTYPLVLFALLSLPLLWWLLRVTPPAPKQISFPAITFLLSLINKEETSEHTPLWLLILRLVICALLILGLSGPLLNAEKQLNHTGPLVLVVDNSWATSSSWVQRISAVGAMIDEAARQNRSLVLVPTTPAPQQTFTPSLLTAAQAKQALNNITPHPWAPDRHAAFETLKDFVPILQGEDFEIVWFSDGIDHGIGKAAAQHLAQLGPTSYWSLTGANDPLILLPPTSRPDRFVTRVVRSSTDNIVDGNVIAAGTAGRL